MTRKTAQIVAAAAGLLTSILALCVQAESAGAWQQGERGGNAGRHERVIELNKFERASRVSIKPVSTDLVTLKQRFSSSRAEEKVLVAVSISNAAAEPISVVIGDPRIQYRPRLLKDGKLLPYTEEVVKVVRAKERSGPGAGRVISGEINPRETVAVDHIDLADWYGTLEPGQYELTIKYRFRHRGQPVETNTITFEVAP